MLGRPLRGLMGYAIEGFRWRTKQQRLEGKGGRKQKEQDEPGLILPFLLLLPFLFSLFIDSAQPRDQCHEAPGHDSPLR
jgi:hypothetical protein